jgi:hypothetical protein
MRRRKGQALHLDLGQAVLTVEQAHRYRVRLEILQDQAQRPIGQILRNLMKAPA